MNLNGGGQIRATFGLRYFVAAMVRLAALSLLVVFSSFDVSAQSDFEDREIREVAISLAGSDQNAAAIEQFRIIARSAVGPRYEAVKIRDAIERLYDTREIATVCVNATPIGAAQVDLQFVIKRRTRAQRVSIEIPEDQEDSVTEQELLVRLDILDPGTTVSERTLERNADLILEYLRRRGFYKAEATFAQQPQANDTEVAVVFRVNPGPQATVESFNLTIDGFNTTEVKSDLKLQPGKEYTEELLTADVERIREALRKEDFLAPQLEEPRTQYDSDKNTVAITITGRSGPTVEVTVEAEQDSVGEGTQNRLLPLRREGTLDYAAIIEGERRLETYYQERGYFFVNVRSVCSVEPPFAEGDASSVKNETEFLCSALSSADLANRKVLVKYVADLDRKLTLKDIRLRGTNRFTITEIKSVLETQEANILGIIPLFGYGRGYTSAALLEEDSSTIRSLLRELGYRDATVRVNQGVSPDGESLIITFVVEEGVPTVISDVEIRGNTAFSTAQLEALIPNLEGKNFSRARLRNGQRKIAEFYSKAGYFDARVTFSIDNVTRDAPDADPKQFRIIYQVENEGKPVYVNRVLVTGNENTKTAAILKAVNLKPGELLRSTDIYSSEQNLYSSDVFSRVEIKPQPAGDRPDGARLTDVVISVQEQAPRILSYGGGFSTDLGASGFVDIRHLNLRGNLWQGGARLRVSQRQQLAQIDFINPRFIHDGRNRFAPLTVSASYQRDTTVTRFFRSAFDTGTFGVVQRLDAEGNPIDEFGADTGSPTLNRLTLTAETNRTISLKNRSILFFRYRFEDVRLYNINSLLIKDLLLPDSRIRISGFGATFVRDTRKNCNIRYTILDIINRGEVEEPCRYSASDPTDGDYFTAEYNVSARILGANIGFNKFQASYNIYRTVPFLKNTTFAGRAILGLASVFSGGNRFSSSQFPGLDGVLPISERFFAGGANTLRGFEFESAGPRVVIVPQGVFRNSRREPVFLDPFTVPFGGNALAVVNLEARIPVTDNIRAVPFYDGGNVFRRVGDIFNPPDVPANDVFQQNLRALWSHTVGLGLRLKLPVGGEIGIDYGFLLNPPEFQIPQQTGPNAIYRLAPSQIHFRFSQAF